jgi:hypothetical protein
MKPYTYLIRHRPTGKVYYGFRCANKVEAHDDLWKHYFTSSTGVQKLIEETGADSFDTEIRRVFETKEQAVSWETRVLHRCKVLHDDRWLNQNVAGYIVPTEESNKKISDFHKDKPKSKEHKQKMREAQKGKPKKSTVYQTLEYKALMSKIKSGKGNARYGVEVSEETRRRISEAKKGKQVAHNKGMPMSEEQKAKIRATKAARPTKRSAEAIAKTVAKQTGLKRTKLHCDHCGRDIAQGWFHRHGDHCASINTP